VSHKCQLGAYSCHLWRLESSFRVGVRRRLWSAFQHCFRYTSGHPLRKFARKSSCLSQCLHLCSSCLRSFALSLFSTFPFHRLGLLDASPVSKVFSNLAGSYCSCIKSTRSKDPVTIWTYWLTGYVNNLINLKAYLLPYPSTLESTLFFQYLLLELRSVRISVQGCTHMQGLDFSKGSNSSSHPSKGIHTSSHSVSASRLYNKINPCQIFKLSS